MFVEANVSEICRNADSTLVIQRFTTSEVMQATCRQDALGQQQQLVCSVAAEVNVKVAATVRTEGPIIEALPGSTPSTEIFLVFNREMNGVMYRVGQKNCAKFFLQ